MTAHLTAIVGDITDQHVDVIVNAANSTLLGGGGVDGAIHRRGGPDILAACIALREGAYPEGLPARWVVHTVGPVHSGREDRSEVLAACYRSCLAVADELGATSIAFPAISTGAYGWPADDAARIAVRTVAATPTRSVTDVRFVLFSAAAHAIVTAELEQLG